LLPCFIIRVFSLCNSALDSIDFPHILSTFVRLFHPHVEIKDRAGTTRRTCSSSPATREPELQDPSSFPSRSRIVLAQQRDSAQAPLRLASRNSIPIQLCARISLDYSSLILLARLYSCSFATREPGIPGKIDGKIPKHCHHSAFLSPNPPSRS
jgi:hypothetical protein